MLSAVWGASFAAIGPSHAVDGEKEGAPFEILAFGDSLTAGYGLAAGEGFTDQLEAWLNANMDRSVTITNGGVSGDTTTGGRSRLEWGMAPFAEGKPDLVILTLGGNDGLRGIDPKITRENIDAMVKTLTEKGHRVLIGGMLAPPNLGPDYAAVFDPTYTEVAEKYGQPLYPFFLDGVAADTALNQADGIHPNAEGVKIIVGKIGPVVKGLLER
ncbi:MAG: arylesterase [Alphaproteobacteria bacterium]|nr:arylesterase [Alphaproteobacteria bacterium]